jgi:hypothetical protein
MEAAAIGFLPDGVGWHELAKPFSSEIFRFTWQVSARGQLLIEFTRYLLVRTDLIAGRIRATEVLHDHEPLIRHYVRSDAGPRGVWRQRDHPQGA